MQFIKDHILGIILSLIIFSFVLLFTAILLSPKTDSQKRGFIPCTDALIEDLTECGNKVNGCTINAILEGTACDYKVVYTGIKDWFKGEQDYPWSNYIFPPEPTKEDLLNKESFSSEDVEMIKSMASEVFNKLPVSDEELDEMIKYYEEHPNMYQEMQELIKTNKELENGI